MNGETATKTSTVEFTKNGGVGIIRFGADGNRVPITSRLLGELGTCVANAGDDPTLRFVIFRGTKHTFLGGEDIHELAHFTEDQGQSYAKQGKTLLHAIESLPQVTFAAISGDALGGGCALALACDFRIATVDACLGHNEPKYGFFPSWGSLERLPRLVGFAKAKQLLFSGEILSAKEALRIGLVDEVVQSEEMLDAAIEHWFETVSGGAPAAVTRIKRVMLGEDDASQYGLSFNCSDAREGVQASLQGRQPNWTNWADCRLGRPTV